FSNNSSTFLLTDLGGPVGPSQTIIGGTANSNVPYTNANNSIVSNGPHNPFVQGSETFVLTVPGVRTDTVANVGTFFFGTTPGDGVTRVTTTDSGVPEPATGEMLIMGVSMVFIGSRQLAKKGADGAGRGGLPPRAPFLARRPQRADSPTRLRHPHPQNPFLR